jgi:RNA polymerase sigma-70 factor (ECF subfamily)
MTQPQHELTETGSIVDIEAIYREHYSRFLRFAVANLGDVEPGRDAGHEAFVRAIRSLSDFRGEGRPESWLWRILVNVCTAEKRRRVVPIDDARLATNVDDPEWPEIRAAIASLPERQRTILFLRHYADLDYDQIGAVLGIARGTVAATLNTAHTRLRSVLGEVKR